MSELKLDENVLSNNGIYYLSGEIKAETIDPLIKWILSWNLSKTKPERLQLFINSIGGHLDDAFALIDIMNGSSIPVHTTGLGIIASCGLLIFMCGEKGNRELTPNTSILSHQFTWGMVGKHHELVHVNKQYDLTQKRMMELYKRQTTLDKKKIEKILLPPHDVWLSHEEALEYGICDRVVEL